MDDFDAWMAEVDRHLGREIPGLVWDDLPDIDYHGRYADGVEPSQAAAEALKNAGYENTTTGGN